MTSYHTTKLFIGLVGLTLIIAVVQYHSIGSMVEGGPCWATLPSEAQHLGTYISAGEIKKNEVGTTPPEPKVLAVWREYSHSWVRTGPFSCSAVVNKNRLVRGLCDSTLLKLCLKGGWRFEVDGKQQELSLTSSGVTFGGFSESTEAGHIIKLSADSGAVLVWTVRFKDEHPNL